MNIKDTFLKLTRYTYPHGTEHFLESYLPVGFEKDEFDNYFYKIGDSETMFTCHLDTACSDFKKVNHLIEESFIYTDGSTILGADDKAGMTILLFLIENKIPGLYYFFVGEEVGCIGSSNASYLDFSKYKRCVSFDRRGYNSVITHQIYGRCCSDAFGKKLAKELSKDGLDFYTDITGLVTDSASFMDNIPECTNISVGYFNEHTVNEKQDIVFLEKLCNNLLTVKWEELPTERNINDYSDIEYYTTYEEEGDDVKSGVKINLWIENELYSCVLKESRVKEEREYISDWIKRSGSYYGYNNIEWDGKSCYLVYNQYKEYIGERTDLVYVIDKLSKIPISDIKSKKII